MKNKTYEKLQLKDYIEKKHFYKRNNNEIRN
jgi:hypothetical protein